MSRRSTLALLTAVSLLAAPVASAFAATTMTVRPTIDRTSNMLAANGDAAYRFQAAHETNDTQ